MTKGFESPDVHYHYKNLDQTFQQDNLSIHLPTIYIEAQAVKEVLIKL